MGCSKRYELNARTNEEASSYTSIRVLRELQAGGDATNYRVKSLTLLTAETLLSGAPDELLESRSQNGSKLVLVFVTFKGVSTNTTKLMKATLFRI